MKGVFSKLSSFKDFSLNDALNYDRWYRSIEGEFVLKKELELILSELDERGSLLEVGCGTGVFMEELRRHGFKVVGLDISEPMIEVARRKGLTVVLGDGSRLPFKDHSFDYVLFITSLEFMRDPESALAEARRVAKRKVLLGLLGKVGPIYWVRKLTGEKLALSGRYFKRRCLEKMMERKASARGVLLFTPYFSIKIPFAIGDFFLLTFKV